MKRLIKKSEIYNGANLPNTINSLDYVECFINPTSKEFDIVKKIYRIRANLLEDGTLYIWPGLLLHGEANNLFNIPDGLHLDIFSSNSLGIYLQSNTDLNYLKNAFLNCTSLYNYMDQNAKLEYLDTKVYKAEDNPIYKKLKKISDIINLL